MRTGRRSDTGRLIFGLTAFGVRELAATALVLIGASLVLFLVLKAAPADTEQHLRLGLTGGGEGAEASRVADPPSVMRQYAHWLTGAIQGDFGKSDALQRGRPAAQLIWPAAHHSFGLLTVGMVISLLIALIAATGSAVRPYASLWRIAGIGVGLVSVLPVFLYVYFFVAGGNRAISWGAEQGYWLLPHWFPLPNEAALAPWLMATLILAVGDGGLMDLYQRFRGEMRHATSGEYMTGVRMMGLSKAGVVARGFVPGALSHMSRRISFFLGSLVVLEAALGWPGLGYLAWRAAAERDMPVLLGAALVMAVALRLVLMASDFIGFVADPRRRR